jgi:hypothetical protein
MKKTRAKSSQTIESKEIRGCQSTSNKNFSAATNPLKSDFTFYARVLLCRLPLLCNLKLF